MDRCLRNFRHTGYGPGLRTEDGAGLANGEVPDRARGWIATPEPAWLQSLPEYLPAEGEPAGGEG